MCTLLECVAFCRKSRLHVSANVERTAVGNNLVSVLLKYTLGLLLTVAVRRVDNHYDAETVRRVDNHMMLRQYGVSITT